MANVIGGFRSTGISPFNPQAITAEHFQASSIEAELTFKGNAETAATSVTLNTNNAESTAATITEDNRVSKKISSSSSLEYEAPLMKDHQIKTCLSRWQRFPEEQLSPLQNRI